MLSALVPAAAAGVVEAPPAEVLRFVTAWLGVWPMPHRLRVAPSARRLAPSRTGDAEQLAGIRCDARFGGAMVLSVTPLRFPAMRQLVEQLSVDHLLTDRDALMDAIPSALERPTMAVVDTPVRWTVAPTELPVVGTWRGSRLLGVGPRRRAQVDVRRINRFGHELVLHVDDGTDWCLSAALLAQAARRVISDGAVPVLRRDLDRPAVAAIATVAGFHDAGWRAVSLAPRSALPTNRPTAEEDQT